VLHPRCSTPEGIETVIRRSSSSCAMPCAQCSTPEGIETVIRSAQIVVAGLPGVLNARRHRDGDQTTAPTRSVVLRCAHSGRMFSPLGVTIFCQRFRARSVSALGLK
jgi:hypothetical protein